MAQELTPADFNKACLMTYGEIAERLAYWMELQRAGDVRTSVMSPLGPVTIMGQDEPSAEWAKRVAAGLLKLSTEDVR